MPFILTACNSQTTTLSNLPAIPKAEGEGPWRVVTYEGEPIKKDVLSFSDIGLAIDNKDVYLSTGSQFVFKSGDAIKTFDNKNIFLNIQGIVIDSNLNAISKDHLFKTSTGLLKQSQPLMIEGFR